MAELSVVIVTIKDEDEILCLPKFEESDFDDYEVIIRDDEGIAKARNEGIKKADGNKIAFIDEDAEPMDGYIQAAASVLEDEYVVAGKVIRLGEGVIFRMPSHYPTSHQSQYVEGVVGCNMGTEEKCSRASATSHFTEDDCDCAVANTSYIFVDKDLQENGINKRA